MTAWVVTAAQRCVRLCATEASLPLRALAHDIVVRLTVDRSADAQPPLSRRPAPLEPLADALPAAPSVGLVYELLDAHEDTAQLATDFASDPAWSTHLLYRRQLQRVGREVLADACSVHVQ
jgi:hypothetical protein